MKAGRLVVAACVLVASEAAQCWGTGGRCGGIRGSATCRCGRWAAPARSTPHRWIRATRRRWEARGAELGGRSGEPGQGAVWGWSDSAGGQQPLGRKPACVSWIDAGGRSGWMPKKYDVVYESRLRGSQGPHWPCRRLAVAAPEILPFTPHFVSPIVSPRPNDHGPWWGPFCKSFAVNHFCLVGATGGRLKRCSRHTSTRCSRQVRKSL